MARTKKAQAKAPAKKPVEKPVRMSAIDSEAEEELEESQPLASSTAHVSSDEVNFGSFLILLLQQSRIHSTMEASEASETESENEETELAQPAPRPRKKVGKLKQSRSARSGLFFPVGRIHRTLKESGLADRVSLSKTKNSQKD
jgi:hypothetical protein